MPNKNSNTRSSNTKNIKSTKSTHNNQKSGTARSTASNAKTTSKNTTKNNARSNSASSKRESAKAHERYLEEQQERKEVMDEVVLIVTGLICILLYLSYFGLCSIVGDAINTVVFGFLGGYLPYVFPIVLFIAVAFIRSNSGNPIATRKTIYFTILVFDLSALIHIISGYSEKLTFFQAFSCGSRDHVGGGLVGACLSEPLMYFFARIASILILIALFIVCIILMTGKTIYKAIQNAKEKREYYYEEPVPVQTTAARKEQESPYRQMHMDEIQPTNGKRKLVVVDAIPPSQEVDTSFYSEPTRKEKKKTSFLDRLKNDYSQPNVQEPSSQASYEPLNATDSERLKPVDPTPRITYSDELARKFNADAKLPNDSVVKHAYDEDDFGFTITNMHSNEESFDNDSIDDIQPVQEHKAETPSEPAKKSVSDKSSDVSIAPLVIEKQVPEKEYVFPPVSLLSRPKGVSKGMSNAELKETASKLQNTLRSFGVNVTITNISCGPSVTRYELQPEQGVKVSRITALADDIKLNLAAEDIRIEAPIPGKAAVGIEVPNHENSTVMLRTLLESIEFTGSGSKIAFAVGKDISGNIKVTDIAKMPHLLIAGATGSGKSVCINTLIMSILYKYAPKDVRLIMIDPKVVELSVYNGIPHLLIPVVTDPKKASSALNWAVMEMTDRYNKFAELGVRDLGSYNQKLATSKEPLVDNTGEIRTKLPQIVIIVDELADLMMVAPGEVEDAICRLAQLARAAGIHLVIATQRPSVNVITGLIKANVPSRIAFSVSSAIDSRTILDQGGAEKLLGKGDMLFFPSGLPKPIRVQGAFVSDTEVSAVVDFLKEKNSDNAYNSEVANHIANGVSSVSNQMNANSNDNDRDEYFVEAGRFIIEKDKASIGMLQRVYKIGFNRAARIMDQLAEAGVVGPEEGTKPRKILMTAEEFEQHISN